MTPTNVAKLVGNSMERSISNSWKIYVVETRKEK
jgi:hypothetical protein